MKKIRLMISDELATRMNMLIPLNKQNDCLVYLIEKEITRLEKKLYECAKAVEKDPDLKEELRDWENINNFHFD
jgi:hypothetical protein